MKFRVHTIISYVIISQCDYATILIYYYAITIVVILLVYCVYVSVSDNGLIKYHKELFIFIHILNLGKGRQAMNRLYYVIAM